MVLVQIAALFEPDVIARAPTFFASYDFPGLSEYVYGVFASPFYYVKNVSF